MTLSPKSSSIRGFLPVLTRLVVASACIALVSWGKRFCSDAIDSLASPGPFAALTHLAAVLSWILFFGPFGLLGLYALVRACVVFYRALDALRPPDAVQILPPFSGTAVQAGESAAGRFRTYSPVNEPLDDATRRRLDQLAARAVKVSGVAVGMFFVGLGLAGFLWAWMQEHGPPPKGGIINAGLLVHFLVACGISVLVGAFILRETFARQKTGWLAPLRVFTAIATQKLTEEELRRRDGMTR